MHSFASRLGKILLHGFVLKHVLESGSMWKFGCYFVLNVVGNTVMDVALDVGWGLQVGPRKRMRAFETPGVRGRVASVKPSLPLPEVHTRV